VEPVLGSDLRHVRVHTSPSARAQAAGLRARAFTHQSHIWLGPGESIDDTELMAHESAHVLQQAGAPPLEQLPPSGLGSRLSAAYGRDLSGARFHLDSPLPRSLGKDAVTVGDHVSFAPGSYRPGIHSGDRLIAHELAHVAQQRGGTGGGEATPPTVASLAAAEGEATFAADTALAGGAVGQLSAVPGQPAQGGVLDDALGGIAAGASAAYKAGADVASAAYETGAELMEEGLDWAIEQFWDIVRAVFPEAEPYLRNPALLWQKITDWVMEGFDSLLSGIFSAFEEGGIFGGLGEFFEGLSVSIEGILAGLAEGDCGPLFAALQSAVDAFLQFAEPVLGPAKALFDSISAGLGGVFDMVVAPVLDLLRDAGGAAWEWLSGLVDSVVEIAGEVKDLAGVAWDFMKDLLGLSGDDSSSSGIWSWIRDSVGALWEEVKPTLMGWVEPLKTVAGVLIAFSPVGPIFLAFRYGPRLVRWLIELWNTVSDPQNLVAAREYVTGTLLPGAMAFLEEMAGQLNSVAAGVTEALRSLSGPLADLVAAFDAVSFLKTVASAVSYFAELVQEGISWAGETLGSFFASVTQFLQDLWAWLRPVLGAMLKVLFIVGNPLGIPLLIASYVWRAIPDCIKKPIIGFILDLLIKFIDKLPDLAGAGLLWPMVKHGVLGFLREIRGQGDAGLDRAVAASNRIALLLTGPVDFLLGIGKGLLSGIWDGIVGPFELVWLLLQAQVRIAEFFESVSNDFSTHFQRLISSLSDIGSYVRDNFWGAVESAFGSEGGEGSPLDRVMSLLGRAWDAVTGAAGSVGAAIAAGLISYLFLGDFELGDKLGYVAGLVIFEVALAILTAGVSAELKFFETTFGQVLRLLVRANEALGAVFGQILKIIPGLESALTRLFTMLGDAPIIRQLVARFRTFFTHLEELSLAGMRRYGGELATAGAGTTGRVLGSHADETARALGHTDDAAARTAGSHADETAQPLGHTDDAAARTGTGHADEAVPSASAGDSSTTRMAEGNALEPGIIAERPIPGTSHRLKITETGQLVRCSHCDLLELVYKDTLDQFPDLARRLREIKALRNPDRAAKFVLELDLATRTRIFADVSTSHQLADLVQKRGRLSMEELDAFLAQRGLPGHLRPTSGEATLMTRAEAFADRFLAEQRLTMVYRGQEQATPLIVSAHGYEHAEDLMALGYPEGTALLSGGVASTERHAMLLAEGHHPRDLAALRAAFNAPEGATFIPVSRLPSTAAQFGEGGSIFVIRPQAGKLVRPSTGLVQVHTGPGLLPKASDIRPVPWQHSHMERELLYPNVIPQHEVLGPISGFGIDPATIPRLQVIKDRNGEYFLVPGD
jgi:hypothetical protein